MVLKREFPQMRVLDFNSTTLQAARWLIRVAAICTLGACSVDTVQRAVGPTVVASVRVYLTTSSVEPLDSTPLNLDVHDIQGRSVDAGGFTTSWTSSDESVASVVGGLLVAHATGDVTITGTVNGVSGSVIVHVAWRRETQLVIGSPGGVVEAGSRIVFSPAVVSTTRRQILAKDVAWSSSDPSVARIQAPGELLTLAPGTTTVVARFLGLADSVAIDVAVGTGGFGYFYSGNAVGNEPYDDPAVWTPPAGMGFTTSGNVWALWELPYASQPSLGWIGSGSPARDAILHAVSLENLFCTAYVQSDTGFHFATTGAPLVDCGDASRAVNQQSVRMEFLAFRPAEFTGTLGMVRPGWPPVSTTAGGLSETSATADSRAYAMPGVARDSLFWFVTPGAPNVSSCAAAPADAVVSQTVVRVICAGVKSLPFQPLFYAVGFGPDARRGTMPIGFAEVGTVGNVVRKAVDGLDIATSSARAGVVQVIVSGPRLAAFDRVPAILVTAIAPVAATCGIVQPVRGPAGAWFLVTCPDSASGFTLGVVY
jgi:hypothetical protein